MPPRFEGVKRKNPSSIRKGQSWTAYKAGTALARRAVTNKFRAPYKSSYAAMGAAVKRGRGIRGETKAVDFPLANYTFANGNSNSLQLNGTQEGTGFWNRIGRKIAMQSLQCTGYIQPVGGVGVLSDETIRYIILYDKQTNGVAPTFDQVVQAYDNAGGVTNGTTDGINMDNRDRFVILRDRKIVMPRTSAAGIAVGPPYAASSGSVGSGGSDGGSVVKEFIKLKNMEVQYNGTANPATVAQITTGGLFIVLQGSTGGQYELSASFRLRFTDN